jgi:allantoinase
MPLPDDYLKYPHRAYGMDQSLYDWRPATARTPFSWPGGHAVAGVIVVPVEHHMLNPAGKPFKHPGAMVTPYPDLRHFTTRDYGNRVGVFRILDALKAAGLKATFPINGMLLSRARPLVDAILEDGHEIAAYGLDTDRIHWSGLGGEVEAGWIEETLALFRAAGLAPTTWMSPARQQSFLTPELLAKAGFQVCLDWESDEVPLPMTTPSGEVLGVPLSNELDDRTLLLDRRQTEDQWADQVLEAASYLADGADRFGGRVLGFTLTPYVAGQPFRIASLRRLLAGLADDPRIEVRTAAQTAVDFRAAS